MSTDEPALALSRHGLQVNRAGRDTASAALARQLDAGQAFTDTTAALDPEQLRAWAKRLTGLVLDLADCVEVPMRNRVMETLESTSVPDDALAVFALRINVAGESPEGLGTRAGISGRTVARIEAGDGCHVGAAKKLADEFGLRTTELFDTSDDKTVSRTVAGLREAMTTEPVRAHLSRGW
jgi:hypothetical protein